MTSENPKTNLESQDLSPLRQDLFKFVCTLIDEQKQIELLEAFKSQKAMQLCQKTIPMLIGDTTEEQQELLFDLMDQVENENTRIVNTADDNIPCITNIQDETQGITLEMLGRFMEFEA